MKMIEELTYLLLVFLGISTCVLPIRNLSGIFIRNLTRELNESANDQDNTKRGR